MRTTRLQDEQRTAKNQLRLSEVAEFIAECALATLEKNVDEARLSAAAKRAAATELSTKARALEDEIKQVQMQLVDERRGADAVNRYLENHFGHAKLRLHAEQDHNTSQFKFRIKRGDADALDLSEGECSLVAFCYFLARLQDMESEGKKLTIWIDDPISSLDGNHIFFVFSLIESVLTRPIQNPDGSLDHRYAQLFITTHNLEFLKYLKRLSLPKNDHQHYVVARHGDRRAVELMPTYLREYVTEFNFLFGEVCAAADPATDANSSSVYNFGNNLRKFLEAYLYFKYPAAQGPGPSEKHHARRVERFFGADAVATILITRITNEFSHLAGVFERAAEPIDRDEIERTAKAVLKRIREADADQYADLLASVDCADPVPT